MWAQQWGNIAELVVPEDQGVGYDLTDLLTQQSFTPKKMVQTAEGFFTSLGIAPLPESVGSVNFCKFCHARILAERFERAPIYWSGCPYAAFQDR